jgi:hypothetical protein
MKDDHDHEFLGVVRDRRGALQEQIKLSRVAVEESVDLLRRIDEVIAKGRSTGGRQ